jgi:hypothetical protein
MANFSGNGAPNQSYVGSKAGDTYTDSQTGTTYTLAGSGKWNQISSGALKNGSPVTDLNSQLATLTGSDNVIQPNYPAGSFDVTPYQTFLDQAFAQLKPYYTQLLSEAGGDLNVALGNLEQDYQTGKRTTMEDFTSSMDTLGATMKSEQTAKMGDMNSRGFALTENPQGQTTYAGGGLAKSELGSLNEDQKLRQEAVQRTQQRGMQSAAITKLTGSEASQQSYRNTTETQQANEENQANTLAGNLQTADENAKNAGIAKAQADATTGSSGGSGGSSWADIYKNIYPGWGETGAKADYKAKNPKETLF